ENIEIITLVTPTRVIAQNGRVSGLECVNNKLGDTDSSGRRRPVVMKGTEHVIALDTLIVAISEDAGIDAIGPAKSSGIDVTKWNTVEVDPATLQTNRPGVFASGDVVTGPNTVVEAIADGKKAAVMIERYLRKMPLQQPSRPRLPDVYVAPVKVDEDEFSGAVRVETPRAPADWRTRNFAEVEVALTVLEATRESCRCLRCDLEFTQQSDKNEKPVATGVKAS
ncbi:MAG: FAD-dependent oxidoreductase, partial [candidate division Zixibacteria bacterium]|nr:FAD-dependent oxidoreductase [candidate division Zixibacteria bacterium]